MFPTFPTTTDEVVTSGLYSYNIEYFEGDDLPDITPFDYGGFNP